MPAISSDARDWYTWGCRLVIRSAPKAPMQVIHSRVALRRRRIRMQSVTLHSSALVLWPNGCNPGDRGMLVFSFPGLDRLQLRRMRPTRRPPSNPERGSTLTRSRSISSNTDRCRRVTERTSRRRCLQLMTIPSTPARNPRLIRTLCPAPTNGNGWTGIWALIAVCKEAISTLERGAGMFPMPKTCITPGVVRIGSRTCMSKRQHT